MLHKLTCFRGRRLTVSMYSAIKQLNKILTAYIRSYIYLYFLERIYVVSNALNG